ncbi:hypothetical protein KTE45_05730 [Burkholderia multivorans]|uniref:hypothetical protein n=1 Tax=Burkholderia multivorans TaxID=87883 RepID=UPI001C272FE5|nr:hypothetical protein [Burkholderia multivorans]MBU9517968.1 hypothetical protein [Burkholderia multivorans]MCA8315971.1 hypothetical protein [Burkholderia multivorans]MCO8647607.1 hypothetical protein [Burkholderia multivorans]
MKTSFPREKFLSTYIGLGLAIIASTSIVFAIYDSAFLKDYLSGSAICLAACFLARKALHSKVGHYIDTSRYTTSASMAVSGLAVVISSAGILLKLGSDTPVFLFVVPATLGMVIHDIKIKRR